MDATTGSPVQGIDPLERPRHPQWLREILRRDVDTEEDCSDSPAPQSRDIGFVVMVLFDELVTFIDNVAGSIDMGVDDEQVGEEVLQALGGTGRCKQ